MDAPHLLPVPLLAGVGDHRLYLGVAPAVRVLQADDGAVGLHAELVCVEAPSGQHPVLPEAALPPGIVLLACPARPAHAAHRGIAGDAGRARERRHVRRSLAGAACSEPDDLGLEFGGHPRIGRKLQKAVEGDVEVAGAVDASPAPEGHVADPRRDGPAAGIMDPRPLRQACAELFVHRLQRPCVGRCLCLDDLLRDLRLHVHGPGIRRHGRKPPQSLDEQREYRIRQPVQWCILLHMAGPLPFSVSTAQKVSGTRFPFPEKVSAD